MKFLNKLLKKKEAANAGPAKKEGKEDKHIPEAKQTLPGAANVLGVLRAPRETEKSSMLGKERQYVFLIERDANKIEVKGAVESRYGVGVEKVGVINLPAKERRRGRQSGWKAGLKKAIVTIKKGQTIELG